MDDQTTNLIICERCGRPLVSPFLVKDISQDIHLFCQNCLRTLQGCEGCDLALPCKYDTDPSPLPKLIEQTFRSGNSIITTQTVNPERVEITCKNGCECYDSENKCMREFDWCGKHRCNTLGGSFYDVIN